MAMPSGEGRESAPKMPYFAFPKAAFSWREDALCYEDGSRMTDLFFSDQLDDIAAARAYCMQCPVREACLDFALNTNQSDGVWGGEYFKAGHIVNAIKKTRKPKRPEAV